MKNLFKKAKEKAPFIVSLIVVSALIGLAVLAGAAVVSHGIVGY